MSPNIYVDDDVFSGLGARARPFIDTEPNQVLRRLLGLDDAAPIREQTETSHEPSGAPARLGDGRRSRSRNIGKQSQKKAWTRAKKGTLLDETAYRMPILQALDERGGSAAVKVVVDRVGELIDDKLLPADREMLETGGIRWQARTQFVRLRMKKEGLLASNSPRGVWEVTDKGRRRLLAGRTTPA